MNAGDQIVELLTGSSGDTYGEIGMTTWDNNYIYIKTNTGWGRSALSYAF